MLFTKEQLQKHGEVILAYINGAKVEYAHPQLPDKWNSIETPTFGVYMLYRVAKPKRKMVLFHFVSQETGGTPYEHFVIKENTSVDFIEKYIWVNTNKGEYYTSSCSVIYEFELDPLE